MKKPFIIVLVVYASISFAQNTSRKSAPEFIVQMADARLMDREEGRLAASLGTTKEIRDYGSKMVSEQQQLFEKLERLANSKGIKLPNAISEKKSKALQKLSTLTGEKFDRKFLGMIKIDHKRDVRRFKKATGFDDAATAKFAKENLPIIQRHLEEVKALIKKR